MLGGTGFQPVRLTVSDGQDARPTIHQTEPSTSCLLPSPFNEREVQVLTRVGVLAEVDEVAQDIGWEQLVVTGDVHLLGRAALGLEDHRVRAVVVGMARVNARRS